MADGNIVGFNEADASEILRLIGGGASLGGGSNGETFTADCLIAVATSVITARVGSTLGTGTAKVKQISSANVAGDLYDVDVVNIGSAIANGSWLKLFRIGNKLSAVEIC